VPHVHFNKYLVDVIENSLQQDFKKLKPLIRRLNNKTNFTCKNSHTIENQDWRTAAKTNHTGVWALSENLGTLKQPRRALTTRTEADFVRPGSGQQENRTRIVDGEQQDRAQQTGRPALSGGETKKSNRRREPRVRRCARGRHSRTGQCARAGTEIEDCHARALVDSWREMDPTLRIATRARSSILGVKWIRGYCSNQSKAWSCDRDLSKYSVL
jgi:hypothetical protein